MRVLVTGSTGLVGSALVPFLTTGGHTVSRLVRDGGGEHDLTWRPQRGEIDEKGLAGFDAVIHLAGESIAEGRWTAEKKARIRDSRVRGTAVLAAAVASRENKPRVFVSSSAIGYYGDRGDEVLTEKSDAGDDYLANVCRAWEAETQPASDAGVRTVVARSGIVLAKHGGALQRMLMPFKLGLGGKQGPGTQWMSWIALDDEIGALRAAIDDDRLRGPVNLTAPNPMRNKDFADTLGRVLHRPTVLTTPLLPLKLRFGTELVETLLLVSQRVEPARLNEVGFSFTYPDLESALDALLRL